MRMLHFYSRNKLPFRLSNPCLFLQGTAGYAADTGGWWVRCGVAWFPGGPEGRFDAPKGGCILALLPLFVGCAVLGRAYSANRQEDPLAYVVAVAVVIAERRNERYSDEEIQICLLPLALHIH